MYSWTAGGVRSQSMGQKGSAHRIESVCAWEAGGCITRVPADVGFLLCVLSASSPQNSSEGWRTHTMRAPCERIHAVDPRCRPLIEERPAAEHLGNCQHTKEMTKAV